jgi:glucose/arabinose dehydrogenase
MGRTNTINAWLRLLIPLLIASCGESARAPFSAGVGPTPELPEPRETIFPTIEVAEAIGWAPGTAPTAPEGFTVTAFATNLAHPRWLFLLPNGDVLVAESSAPPPEPGAPEKEQTIYGLLTGFVRDRYAKRAGAVVPSANRISLLRDANGDGVAEVRSVYAEHIQSPFGMALVDDELFIASSRALLKLPYTAGDVRAGGPFTTVTTLPAGINHHWTKNVIASPDGRRLYVTVGSNSNIGENGMEMEAGRAAIWEVDPATGAKRLYATGLRNPNGLGWEPATRTLWTVVNERDEIGSDLVPDYLTSVKEGAFYGWPWSYFGEHIDERVPPPASPQDSAAVANAMVPDYALGTHVAPLGLTFSDARGMPPEFASGVFIGEHGSWNRRPVAGYKVVFIPFADGAPVGMPVDFLTGFLDADGRARGRPVGVALDATGALLVADDVGNTVWRVASIKNR